MIGLRTRGLLCENGIRGKEEWFERSLERMASEQSEERKKEMNFKLSQGDEHGPCHAARPRVGL